MVVGRLDTVLIVSLVLGVRTEEGATTEMTQWSVRQGVASSLQTGVASSLWCGGREAT